MNQLVALDVRPPAFDEPGNALRFQQYQTNQENIKNAQLDNQLAGMKVNAASAQFGAEKNFRDRSAAGDPNADEALSGYPAMQRKIYDAFDGMTPKQYKEATKKAARFGEAARNVLLFRDGTPEQSQAWSDEAQKLADEKIISQDQANRLIKSGPNPLMMEEALSVEQWTKLHEKQKEFATDQKRLQDESATDNERADSKEARLAGNAQDRIDMQQERIDMAREKAGLEADRIQSVIDKNRASGAKSSNEDAVARDEIKSSLRDFRKDLDLNKPEDAAKYDAFRETVFKKFGYGPDGRPTKARALSGDKVGAGDGDFTGRTAVDKNGKRLRELKSGKWQEVTE